MRSRWFHEPVLHAPTGHGEEKKVTWLELFYDLIFVAAIIQLGDFLSEDVSLAGFGKFALHFVPLWIAWTGFTFYVNRFSVGDITHRIMVLAKMFAVGAMAISSHEAMNGNHFAFSISFTAATSMLVLMFVRTWIQVPETRNYCRFWGGVFAIAAVAFAIAAFLPQPYAYGMWAIGIFGILVAPVSPAARRLSDRFPIDQEHLAERYGLLTIIVLGESFVKVLTYLTAKETGVELEYLGKGFFNLALTCCIWWIYFDDIASSPLKKHRGAGVIWLYGHLPLTLAITGVGVAVKKAVSFDLGAVAPDKYRWLLAGTLALTFLSVAIIDSVTERKNAELSDRARVVVRIVSALVVLLLGQVGDSMDAGVFMGVVVSVLVAQVLFDVAMAPFEESDETATAELIAELDKRRRAGEDEGPKRKRVDVSQSVRLGAPSALRKDLYFFFLEGSWARMFLSFGFLYLLLNVGFAGLFMLEPESVLHGDGTFADAFFFSVQTLSTIGYGSMSPGTEYGDVLVTLEAAVGILFAALATGLVFAKASRPQSSVLFSETMVVTQRHGVPTLMFRAANARGNEVVDATIKVVALVDEVTPEGEHMRRVADVPLVRDNSPLFALSWSVMHTIDDHSPLKGIDWDEPERTIMGIIVTMMGHDATYGQATHARHIYYPESIRIGHRFVDVIHQLPDGRLMLDLTQFHETVSDGAQAAAGK